MSIKQVKREYTIGNDDNTNHRLNLLDVISTVPDLTNDELCAIIDLEVGTSIDIDTNITVIRTA